jgi:hypothetical protein
VVQEQQEQEQEEEEAHEKNIILYSAPARTLRAHEQPPRSHYYT